MAGVYGQKDKSAGHLIVITAMVMFALGGWIAVLGAPARETFNGAFIDDGFARFLKVAILWTTGILLAIIQRLFETPRVVKI